MVESTKFLVVVFQSFVYALIRIWSFDEFQHDPYEFFYSLLMYHRKMQSIQYALH